MGGKGKPIGELTSGLVQVKITEEQAVTIDEIRRSIEKSTGGIVVSATVVLNQAVAMGLAVMAKRNGGGS